MNPDQEGAAVGRRLLTLVIAGVVTVAGWAGGSQPARAAGTGWWLPSSWVSVVAGTVAQARDYLVGVGGSVEGSSGGLTHSGDWPGTGGSSAYRYELAWDGSRVTWHNTGVCVVGSWGNPCGADGPAEGAGYSSGSLEWTCVDGSSGTQYAWLENGAIAGYSPCGSHGGWAKIGQSYAQGTAYWQLRAWTLQLGGFDAVVTTVTCRDLSTGVDTEVSESSSSVAPAPVCPAGTVPVRVRISQGGTLLQDSSITQAALDAYGGYLSNPDGWTWRQDGTSCSVQSSADPTMVIALSTNICNEAAENGVTGGDSSQVQDCGSDIVCQAVSVGLAGVRSLLSGVASGIARVVAGVAGVVQAVRGGIDQVIGGIASGIDRVVSAIAGVKSVLEEILGKLTGTSCTTATCGGGAGSGPTGGGPGAGEWADLGSKFSGITGKWDQLVQAFNPPPSGDCRGPAMALPQPMGTIYIMDACNEPMRTAAGVTKLVATIALIVGAVMSVIRMVSAAWGFNTDVGKGS